ncbi:MAG: NAD(+) synthase, partial [Myxococcales bacterium]|nr:NAD(+) synthase [Myxococcales bacterium]
MRGFARISAAVPECAVADFQANRQHHLNLWRQAHEAGAAVVVFPELGLCGYSVRDLFLDGQLRRKVDRSLAWLAEQGRDLAPLALVGLPVAVAPGLYNCAAALQGGRVLGVVPKAYLPTYREFEEARWFRPGAEVPAGSTCTVAGQTVPFGTDLLFDGPDGLTVGVEICEDYWVQVPPSALQVGAGATVICNLSASNFTVGKAELRRLLARAASDRGKCAYVYVAAGPGESSTDLAFDADAFICENGSVLAESTRFARHDQLISVDVDLERLIRERLSTGSFGDCARANPRPFRRVPFTAKAPPAPLRREVSAHPFLPSDPATLATRCWEIFEIQSNALATRMAAIGAPKLVLGVSGGLDSTHAALVAAQALDLRGQPRSDLVCVTMPGLGTTAGTRSNAEVLSEALGATFMEIGVSDASRHILQAVGHPAAVGADSVDALVDRLRADPALGDITLENVQARLRTLLLMTVANQRHGLVVGTGDLSEKALGWATYAGDHIAMYDVNAGVPKTLIRFVIRWVANERAATWTGDVAALRETLFAILDTPISPELLPASEDGAIAQLTEATIGPYELHDFFLYHVVRHGTRPGKVLDLAKHAFGDAYDAETLRRWCRLFLKRFFQNQFKRSCTADGPKVGMVALSPRGD